jgi:hypothetical protein
MPTLAEKQAASRLRHGRRLNAVEETRIRCAMFLILSTADDEDGDLLEKVGRQWGRDRAWMVKWSRAKYPLESYF